MYEVNWNTTYYDNSTGARFLGQLRDVDDNLICNIYTSENTPLLREARSGFLGLTRRHQFPYIKGQEYVHPDFVNMANRNYMEAVSIDPDDTDYHTEMELHRIITVLNKMPREELDKLIDDGDYRMNCAPTPFSKEPERASEDVLVQRDVTVQQLDFFAHQLKLSVNEAMLDERLNQKHYHENPLTGKKRLYHPLGVLIYERLLPRISGRTFDFTDTERQERLIRGHHAEIKESQDVASIQ